MPPTSALDVETFRPVLPEVILDLETSDLRGCFVFRIGPTLELVLPVGTPVGFRLADQPVAEGAVVTFQPLGRSTEVVLRRPTTVAEQACAGCGRPFTPTGGRSLRCAACREAGR